MNQPGAEQKYRIGFLTPYATGAGGFQDMVWRGMVAAARHRGVNLLAFAGGAIDLAPYNPFEKNLNFIYDLIRPKDLDGLVVNFVIGAYVDPERFQEFCRSFGLPVVTILGALQGFPDVHVVNKTGMRDVMLHLIKDHSFRNIAFIKGWEGYPDAEERFAVYQDTLRECGIDYDSMLVYPGQFDVESGVRAVNHWMTLKGKTIDAIVAANDGMAFGAISALRASGKRVPRDMAVTGYDDTAEAAVFTPPLTTVNQPFDEVCDRALDILCGLIEGKEVEASSAVPARMIVRQSCSCLSAMVSDAESATRESLTRRDGKENAHLDERAEAVTQELLSCAANEDKEIVSFIVTDFIKDVQQRRHGLFIRDLRSFFQDKIVQGQDISSWLRCLFLLRTHIPALWTDEEMINRADILILQACVLIGESSLQAAGYQKFNVEKKSKELREVGQSLITTFNFDQLKEVVRNQLARLGVPSCAISVFRNMDNQAAGSEMFLVLTNETPDRVGEQPRERSVQALPDKTFFPADRRYAYAVHPLYFRERRLGYALFELGPEDGVVYDALQVQISSSLMGSELIRQRARMEEVEKNRNDTIQALVRPMLDSMTSVTDTAKEKIGRIGELMAETKENSEKLDNTNRAIKSMTEKIAKMSDVIGIIDDISSRVNILAINTSIESTHAGQFGKGFAVIASEIRKLADSIRENAMVIADQLKDFQPAIDISRKAGQESQEAFRRLEKDVLDVAETLKRIAASMVDLSSSSALILSAMNTARE